MSHIQFQFFFMLIVKLRSLIFHMKSLQSTYINHTIIILHLYRNLFECFNDYYSHCMLRGDKNCR